jgi:hypothetical protein
VADADEISEWAYAAVMTALLYGLMELDGDGRFDPQGTMTLMEFMMLVQ